jgi:hypothetical protein
MYGLINAGVKSYVVAKMGEPAWLVIHQEARTPETFDVKASYNDEVTFNLVFSIAKFAKIDPKTVLEQIGEYWIEFAVEKDYGVIFKMYGKDFRTSLRSLNQMHKRMNSMMPSMVIPNFQIISENDSEIKLLYTSSRKGLTPLALGLLRGLGKYFSQDIVATQISEPEEEKIALANSKNKEVSVFKIQFL